jgi:hypothetical protein
MKRVLKNLWGRIFVPDEKHPDFFSEATRHVFAESVFYLKHENRKCRAIEPTTVTEATLTPGHDFK